MESSPHFHASRQLFDQLHNSACDHTKSLLEEVTRFFEEVYPNGNMYHTDKFEEMDDLDILPQFEQVIMDIDHFTKCIEEHDLLEWMKAPSGLRFRRTIKALKLIEAIQTHSLLQKAWDVFSPQAPCTNTFFRNYQIEHLTAVQLSELQIISDQLSQQNEDLYDLAIQFWKNNTDHNS